MPPRTGKEPFRLVMNDFRQENIRRNSKQSRNWFKQKVKSIGTVTPRQVERDSNVRRNALAERLPSNPIGQMWFYFYDAKTKDQLPYFDRFPLCIPMEVYSDGILGLNLHYLPYETRADLFYELYKNKEKTVANPRARMKSDYQTVKAFGNIFKPCVKRYLTSHIRSKPTFVHPREWEMAIWLPVERFTTNKRTVWKDSRSML